MARIRSPKCARNASTLACERCSTATCAPSAKKRSTKAQPRPEPPPVIRATSPCSQPMLMLPPFRQTIVHLPQSQERSE